MVMTGKRKELGSRMDSTADNCVCTRTVNGEKVGGESRAELKGK